MPTYAWKCNACQCTCDTIMLIRQVGLPESTPTCQECGLEMRRDYRREGVAIAESSRSKGIFPYVDHNLGDKPIEVQDQHHRRRLMKERGLHDRDLSDNTKARIRDAKRKTTVTMRGGE